MKTLILLLLPFSLFAQMEINRVTIYRSAKFQIYETSSQSDTVYTITFRNMKYTNAVIIESVSVTGKEDLKILFETCEKIMQQADPNKTAVFENYAIGFTTTLGIKWAIIYSNNYLGYGYLTEKELKRIQAKLNKL